MFELNDIEKKLSLAVSRFNLGIEEKKELAKEISQLFNDFNKYKNKQAALLLFEILNDYPSFIKQEDEKILVGEFCDFYNLDVKKIEEEFNDGENL